MASSGARETQTLRSDASYGGLAQLGARLVSKHTPSQIVLRQSIPNKKLHPRGSLLGFYGGLAQLGERLHGMQEVSGSIPLSSTKFLGSLSSRGLGHDPFTVGTGVRIPVGTPQSRKNSDIIRTLSWGISSAGRALAWHARGQRFDPAILHQVSRVPIV